MVSSWDVINWRNITSSEIKDLISDGLDVNANDNVCKKTLLHCALDNQISNIDVVTCLIDSGADVNAIDMFGNTPLHNAVGKLRTPIIDCLIKNGANVNIQNKNHKTPLMHLVDGMRMHSLHGNDLDIMKLLIGAGSNVNIQDKRGKTILHYAVGIIQAGSHIMKKLPNEKIRNIIYLLGKTNVNASIRDNDGNTPREIIISNWKNGDFSTEIQMKVMMFEK